MLFTLQTGFKKNMKGGQVVEIYINEVRVEITDGDGGSYLTPLSSRHSSLWYVKQVELIPGDIIRIEAKTGLRGLGPDEDRTFTAILRPDEKESLKKLVSSGVGFGQGVSLIEGKYELVSMVTKKEERMQNARSKFQLP